MLIIINDDAAYVSWISRHRPGFVVDCKRTPAKGHLTLHRATCPIVKPHKRARLTTGAHLKACSLDAEELARWAVEQTGGGLSPCPECQRDHEEPVTGAQHNGHALSRLAKEIVSYVLDLAIMYLDGEERRYHANVETIAAYLDKRPAQIIPPLSRLVAEGYLESSGPFGNGAPPAGLIVYPTARALRSIPAFDAMPEADLRAELNQLRGP